MDANEQRARELLAVEYLRARFPTEAEKIRCGAGGYNLELRAIMAALAQQVPADGEWVLVPREPTPAMIEAIAGELSNMTGEDVSDDYARKAYAAMLAATPQAPQPVVDASQPQQGAVGVVIEGFCDALGNTAHTVRWVEAPPPIGTKLYTTIGQQAVDDAALPELPMQWKSEAPGTCLYTAEQMHAYARAALAAHGKGGVK